MVRLKIKAIGLSELAALWRRRAAGAKDYRRVFEKAHKIVVAEIIRQFNAEGIPRWSALRPSTIRQRGSAHPILRRTGRLKRSYISGPDHIFRVDAKRLIVGSRVPYAIFHQLGAPRRHLRRRPIRITPKLAKTIEKLIINHLEEGK